MIACPTLWNSQVTAWEAKTLHVFTSLQYCCFPYCFCLSCARVHQSHPTSWSVTKSLLVRYQATIPQFEEEIQAFHMAPIAWTLRLEFLPVRVPFLYPGQEDGGRTGWTGQTGQILHCREDMDEWRQRSKWDKYIFISRAHGEPKAIQLAICSLFHWFSFIFNPISPNISILYTAKNANTGWTSQICQPGSESQPVRLVRPVC